MQDDEGSDRLVTLAEGARIVGRNVMTLRRWIDAGRIQGAKDSRGRYLVDRAELEALDGDTPGLADMAPEPADTSALPVLRDLAKQQAQHIEALLRLVLEPTRTMYAAQQAAIDAAREALQRHEARYVELLELLEVMRSERAARELDAAKAAGNQAMRERMWQDLAPVISRTIGSLGKRAPDWLSRLESLVSRFQDSDIDGLVKVEFLTPEEGEALKAARKEIESGKRTSAKGSGTDRLDCEPSAGASGAERSQGGSGGNGGSGGKGGSVPESEDD